MTFRENLSSSSSCLSLDWIFVRKRRCRRVCNTEILILSSSSFTKTTVITTSFSRHTLILIVFSFIVHLFSNQHWYCPRQALTFHHSRHHLHTTRDAKTIQQRKEDYHQRDTNFNKKRFIWHLKSEKETREPLHLFSPACFPSGTSSYSRRTRNIKRCISTVYILSMLQKSWIRIYERIEVSHWSVSLMTLTLFWMKASFCHSMHLTMLLMNHFGDDLF